MTAPARLRTAVERDLAPTRPLRPPLLRTMSLLPLTAAAVYAVPVLHAFRPDLASLGFFRSWVLTAVEAAWGLGVIALAARESIPGRTAGVMALVATFAGGFAAPLGILQLASGGAADLGPAAGHWWRDGAICFRASAAAAAPALIAASFLVSRAYAVRPTVAGALYGLGSGLIGDAGLHLFCEYSAPAHVFAAHLGALLACTLAGALLTTVRLAFSRQP